MKRERQTAELLRGVHLLRELSDAEMSLISEIARRVAFGRGDVVMREGEVGSTMYFFVEGEVDVTKSLTLKIARSGFASAEKSMVKLKAGTVSLFGEMAMLEAEPRSATITASSPCVLYEVSREDFSALCDAHSELGAKLMRRIAEILSQRVRKGNEDVLKLSTALSIALSK